MKVHTTVVQEVTLDGNAVREVFTKQLNSLCGGEDVYLNDKGELEEWEDTGHGSGMTHVVSKKPTKIQIAAIELRGLLHKERMKKG